MSNWFSQLAFWKKSKNIFNEIEFIPQDSSDKIVRLDETNLERIGLDEESFKVHVVEDEKIESTQEYLQNNRIELTIEEEMMIKNHNHRITSRNIILWSIIFPMSAIPILFSILLTLSFLDKINIKQPVQIALISTIAAEYVGGIYFAVTRDLFPQGENERKKDKNSDDNQRSSEK
jgi:hypothetical protein